MIDAHIHLDQYPCDQIDRLIEQWRTRGITGIVAVSTNLASSYQTLFWKAKYPDFIYAAIGYHPEQPLPNKQEQDELFSLIKKERQRICAIGEVGLPHYALEQLGDFAVEHYIELLDEFARIAKASTLPLALHAVHDKAAVALQVLQKHEGLVAHFHWLKAPAEVVARIIQSHHLVSLTPEVCYRERDQRLAAQLPLSQLLLETDGPWPYTGDFKNKKTSPLFLFQSAEKIAAIKQLPVEQVIQACLRNTLGVYGGGKSSNEWV
jgi:TatD DNase family protein